MMLVVLVQVTVKAEMLAEFERAILINADAARTREPGCVRFDVNQREDEPSHWLFYEVYKDAAAFDAHRASPHFAAYQEVAEKALLSKTLTRYTTKN
jgi:(4S)-4-hydroxy-5-phosphonooxypentane-2,3-dione isomerase